MEGKNHFKLKLLVGVLLLFCKVITFIFLSLDENSIRNDVLKKFTKLIDNSEIINELEKGIISYSIKSSNQGNIEASWENNTFIKIYLNKCVSLYANLDDKSYINNTRLKERLLSGEFNAFDLAEMDRVRLFPEIWKKLLDEKQKSKFKYKKN